MIIIKVNSSVDTSSIGELDFYFESITIGKSSTAHLTIADPELKDLHLTLSETPSGLICTSTDEIPFKINGKKISGKKIINIGDKIHVGETELVITAYIPTNKNIPTYNKAELQANYQKIMSEEPEIASLLSILENEIAKFDPKEIEDIEQEQI